MPARSTAPPRPSASTTVPSTTPMTGPRARSTPGPSTRPTSTTSRTTPRPGSSTTPPVCPRSPPTCSCRPTRRAARATSPPAGTPSSSCSGARTSAPTAPVPARSPTTPPRRWPIAAAPTSRSWASCWSTTSPACATSGTPTVASTATEFLGDPQQAVADIFRSMGALSQGELAGERIAVAYDTKDQEDEHSCFSDNTTADIAANAAGVAMIYTADYPGVDGPSLADVVGEVDEDGNQELLDLMDTNVARAEALPAPFDQLILGDDDAARSPGPARDHHQPAGPGRPRRRDRRRPRLLDQPGDLTVGRPAPRGRRSSRSSPSSRAATTEGTRRRHPRPTMRWPRRAATPPSRWPAPVPSPSRCRASTTRTSGPSRSATTSSTTTGSPPPPRPRAVTGSARSSTRSPARPATSATVGPNRPRTPTTPSGASSCASAPSTPRASRGPTASSAASSRTEGSTAFPPRARSGSPPRSRPAATPTARRTPSLAPRYEVLDADGQVRTDLLVSPRIAPAGLRSRAAGGGAGRRHHRGHRSRRRGRRRHLGPGQPRPGPRAPGRPRADRPRSLRVEGGGAVGRGAGRGCVRGRHRHHLAGCAPTSPAPGCSPSAWPRPTGADPSSTTRSSTV